jgi:hypothetical protein
MIRGCSNRSPKIFTKESTKSSFNNAFMGKL